MEKELKGIKREFLSDTHYLIDMEDGTVYAQKKEYTSAFDTPFTDTELALIKVCKKLEPQQ